MGGGRGMGVKDEGGMSWGWGGWGKGMGIRSKGINSSQYTSPTLPISSSQPPPVPPLSPNHNPPTLPKAPFKLHPLSPPQKISPFLSQYNRIQDPETYRRFIPRPLQKPSHPTSHYIHKQNEFKLEKYVIGKSDDDRMEKERDLFW